MEVLEQGYHFFTLHNEDGNVAHVDGHYQRFQKQAPILPRQPFALDFYGKGSSIELVFTTLPRHATPEQKAASQRRRTVQAVPFVTVPSTALLSNSLRISRTSPQPPTPRRSTSPTPPATPPGTMAFTVQPEFHSPFDIDFLDGWGLEEPPFPPFDPTDPPGGGGGGGGGLFHSAVRVELFLYGSTQRLETWDLPEGIFGRFRSVKWQPQGFPNPDHPVRKTTWFTVVVTPQSFDPVEIFVGANTRIADVPIRTTPLAVRLTNHLFRVGLEALAPNAVASGSKVRVSISEELTDLVGVDPVFKEKSIPVNVSGKLRTLKITSVSGATLHELALKNYRARAAKFHDTGPGGLPLTVDQKLAKHFGGQLAKLAQVQNDFVCLRIEAAFTKTVVSFWGFDLAKLNGELGELFLAFDHRLSRVRVFAFFDVDLTTVGSIARDLLDIVADIPDTANEAIEELMETQQAQEYSLKYFRAFLQRAVGPSNVVYDIKFRNDAWQIRNSADPVIPKPGQHLHPPFDLGPIEDAGVVELLSLGHALGSSEPAPIEPAPVQPAPMTIHLPPVSPQPPAEPASPSEPPASMAHELPVGFLTEGEQLNRLDRHQSIVVVMMENRSYDHMLGDLMHLRPDPVDPYDGAPLGTKNAPAGGFQTGVPVVRAHDLLLGTQIPVSPRHSFKATSLQIGDGTDAGVNTGDMAGFARDLTRRSDSPQIAVSIYSQHEVPVHYKLADEFGTCERWFAAHPGPTFPNRFATIMGRIPELENFENDDPRIGYLKDRNIFDVLTGAGIEWRVFESDLSLIRMFDRYRLDSTRVVPFEDPDVGLEATLRSPGPLPRVMFIEPDFADIPPLKTASDDHPPADLKNGQAFISRVCNLLWDTARFGEILLVITYDEHGGFYDHVPPPGTPKGEPGNFGKLHPDGPTHLGVRVPTFVVSPYISAHAKNRTIFDHTSILKTILVHNRIKLSSSVMTSFGDRVNQAADLSAVLDLADPRPKPEPFIRRGTTEPSHTFGTHVDISTLLDLTAELAPATTTFTPLSGITPRELVVTERTTPPGMVFEAQDFHASLTKLMKPRHL